MLNENYRSSVREEEASFFMVKPDDILGDPRAFAQSENEIRATRSFVAGFLEREEQTIKK